MHSTAREYRSIIDTFVLPAMKHLKVAEVSYSNVDGLHRKVTNQGARYRANRVVAVLSKMFGLTIRWDWRKDNPAKGIEAEP